MRVTLLSDIHGNNFALQKVLEHAGTGNQAIVCLGDVVWGGPQPSEVLRELRRLRCSVVMGNTDEVIIGTRRERVAGWMRQIGDWSAKVLSDEDREFMRGFRPTVSVDLGYGQQLLCYHGSPRSNTERIESTTPDSRLRRILGDNPEKFMAGGHTHKQMIRRYKDRFVINPGSIGLPFEFRGKKAVNPAWAEYATIDCRRGSVRVSMKRVEYDVKELAGLVERSGIPHPEWWMKGWTP